MKEQLCPVCGCVIVGKGYKKKGVKYCCEPCATGGGPCECGCLPPCGRKEEKTLG